MSASQLAAHLEIASPLLLDVREPWEFDICHIEGSINLPMAQIPLNIGRFQDSEEVVVICHHGIRSRQVALYMERQGFAKVINMEGGVTAWAREVDPAMPTY